MQFHIGLLAKTSDEKSTYFDLHQWLDFSTVGACLGVFGDHCGIYCIVNAAFIIAKLSLPKSINDNFWRLACRSACAYGNAIVAFFHTPCR